MGILPLLEALKATCLAGALFTKKRKGSMMKKIVFVGAGSIVFTKNLLSDMFLYPELKDTFIGLMDIDEERLQVTVKMAQIMRNEKGSNSKIEAYTELESALRDADYVINTVQIGGKDATYVDFDIPEKYGLKQTIGDTHGIGGVMRFLRTAPFLKKLVKVMEKVCPKALLFNFTNPMSMCMWYINSISEIENVGLCHSIPNTIEQLSRYVGVPLNEVNYKVAGINHMAWVLKYERAGEDLYPLLFKAMKNKEIWKKDSVRFELLRRFSYFVTESSEHNAEYVPYFIKDQKLINKLKIPIREYITRVELNERVYQTYKAYYLEGKDDVKNEGTGMLEKYYGEDEQTEETLLNQKSNEYALQIVHAIETGETTEVYGIVPNRGIIDNLPYNCMVEISCVINKNGIQPTYIGELPPQLAALNISQIRVQELAVKAAITGQKKYVHYAILLDPLASSILSMDEIHNMTEELINAHKKYLSTFIR